MLDRIFRGRLINKINRNSRETLVDLIATILSVCANIQKYARYICARTQWALCVTSSITLKSQAASSTALVDYWIILLLKCTTIDVFLNYINKNKTNFRMFFSLVFFLST